MTLKHELKRSSCDRKMPSPKIIGGRAPEPSPRIGRIQRECARRPSLTQSYYPLAQPVRCHSSRESPPGGIVARI